MAPSLRSVSCAILISACGLPTLCSSELAFGLNVSSVSIVYVRTAVLIAIEVKRWLLPYASQINTRETWYLESFS